MLLKQVLKSSRQESLDEKQKEGKAFKLQGYIYYRGLKIAVENKIGSVRKGVDDDGEEWKTKMFHDYGYIVGTMGVDGDPIDVYLGPHEEAENVYIVHQKNPGTGKFDEDKCMLGFADRIHARDAYLAHYDSYEFLGPIDTMPFEEFKKKVLATKEKPSVIKSLLGLFKSLNDNERKEFNDKHPRDEKGKFAEKNYLHAEYEKFVKDVVGNYKTPVGTVKITPSDFVKIYGLYPIGKEKFQELLENNRVDWSRFKNQNNRGEETIGIIKNLLESPTRISKNISTKIPGDYVFVLERNNRTYYLAISKDDKLKTSGIFEKKYTHNIEGEQVYPIKNPVQKGLGSNSEFPTASGSDSRTPNLIISGFNVKDAYSGNFLIRILRKSQMNLFGSEGNKQYNQMNLFRGQSKQDEGKHVGDIVPGQHGTLIVKKNPTGRGAHLEYLHKLIENKKEKTNKDDEKRLYRIGGLSTEKWFVETNDSEEIIPILKKYVDFNEDRITIEEAKPEEVEKKSTIFSKDTVLYGNEYDKKGSGTPLFTSEEEPKPGDIREVDGKKMKLNENYQWDDVEEIKSENNFGTGKNAKIKIDSKHIAHGFMAPDWSWTILNDVPLSEGQKLINSTIIQKKINGYNLPWRVSIIENGDGGRFAFYENGKEEYGTPLGATLRFHEIKDDEINDTPKLYSTIGRFSQKFWDENKKDTPKEDSLFGPGEDKEPHTVEQKVQKRLDDVQKDKEFKDAGERVPLSKKEMAAYRKFTLADLEKIDNASAFTLVTKDKFIPDLDIEKLKEEGQPSGLVWYKKKLRDLLAQKPENKESARKLFVDKLPAYFEKIDSAKSIEEIIDYFRDEFEYRRKSYRSDSKTYALRNAPSEYKDLALENVFGKPFMNFLVMENDTAKNQIATATMLNAYSKEEAQQQYQNAIDRFDVWKAKQIEEAKSMTDEKLGSELGYEYNNSPFLTSAGLTPQKVYNAKREKPEEYKAMLNKYREFRIKRAENSKLSFNNFDEFIKQRPKYAPREDDWSWLNSTGKKERQVNTELKIHDNPPLDFIKRKDGREVTADEIRPETIIKNFGFKSVQLGHYVKDKEAKEHIKHFIASMKDLEDVLGIDLKKLNEEGGLSLAFGARGHGGALAHYEPTFKIINITKSRGDGSIAHEWTHYLDHFLGGGLLPDKQRNQFVSHQAVSGGQPAKDELIDAVASVNEAIRKGEGSIKKKFEPTTTKAYIPGLKSLFDKEGLEGATNYIKTRLREADKKFAFEILAKINGSAIEIELPKTKSDFLEGAQSFKSDYWVRPLEMFARAAEAYIYDKLEEKKMYNNYLVGGNKAGNADMKWDMANLSAAYPQGEERKRINSAFDKLFDVLKKRGYQKKYEVPETRVDEFIDLQKSIELEFLDFIIEPNEEFEEIVI